MAEQSGVVGEVVPGDYEVLAVPAPDVAQAVVLQAGHPRPLHQRHAAVRAGAPRGAQADALAALAVPAAVVEAEGVEDVGGREGDAGLGVEGAGDPEAGVPGDGLAAGLLRQVQVQLGCPGVPAVLGGIVRLAGASSYSVLD